MLGLVWATICVLSIDDPSEPALVALEFRNKAFAEIVRGISTQSGNVIAGQGGITNPNPEQPPPRFTLETPAPVPFWEAVDRLAAATRQRYQLEPMLVGAHRRPGFVQFGTPGLVNGLSPPLPPAQYAGPFRLGELSLHAHYARGFLGKETPVPGGTTPFYAEFPMLAEPRVMVLRTAPVRVAEATDDRGQSLAPEPAVPANPSNMSEPFVTDFLAQVTVRIPLKHPEQPGSVLRSLRGEIPVELAHRAAEPAATAALADSVGREFRAGDLVARVEEFAPQPGGGHRVKLDLRIDGPRGGDDTPIGLISARLSLASQRLVEIVDADGRESLAGSMATDRTGARNQLKLEWIYTPNTQAPRGGKTPGPPRTLRLYEAPWVDWGVPFAFGEIPLP